MRVQADRESQNATQTLICTALIMKYVLFYYYIYILKEFKNTKRVDLYIWIYVIDTQLINNNILVQYLI